MKKGLIVVLSLVFLLSACAGFRPENPQETSAVTRFVRSGTQGLDITFADNLPPRQVYDTVDLYALVELRNLGNYDIEPDECFIQFGGFDPSIVRGVNQRQSCGDIPGKDELFIDGGFATVDFKSSGVLLPNDVDLYQPPIVATACYEYQTVASPQVCIDPGFFDVTREQRACQVRDFGLGGGQGAPVAVTFVNVDMVGSRAVFQIDVQNVGRGRVVTPRASLNQCPNALQYDDFDQARYNIELPGGRLIKCAPNDFLVRFTNNRGKIVCTFDVGNTQAYETPLRIELNYNYIESIRRQVEIVRTPN